MAVANLYIQYKSGDTGTRSPGSPIPAGTDFWDSPGVRLDTANGAVDSNHYNSNNQPCGILVDVHNDSETTYSSVTVEVWLCDPSTAPAPRLGLPFVNGSATTTLTNTKSNPTGSVYNFSIQNQFIPYAGLGNIHSGHLCLIANCYGTTIQGDADGEQLLISLPTTFDVMGDKHHAQRNIFAQAGSGAQGMKFGFNAGTAREKGTEDVTLEILHVPGPRGVTADDLAFLHNGPFKHLPLHPSTLNVKDFLVGGAHCQPARKLDLKLQAGHPTRLELDVQFDHHEKKGAVHSFAMVQKGQDGKVHGGLRILAVINH